MATAFPTISEEIPAQAATDIGRAPVYDNDASAFTLLDGALSECSGVAAVRQWIRLMLKQPKGKIPIYQTDSDTQPGIDRSLFGQRLPKGMLEAELIRGVQETLAFCPAIRSADGFSVTREFRTYTITCTVHLYDGSSLEVTEDV